MNFRPEKDIILEDDRALLRPLVKRDIEHLLVFAETQPELWRYSLQSGAGAANLKAYIDTALAGRTAGHSYPFIVYDKRAQTYAGSTRFYDIQTKHSTTQLGFTWYAKEFQRTGLNQHCKHLLLSHAFDQLGAARVELRADANNTRSIKAMKNIGCVEEGILRSNCASPRGRRDSIVLSILAEEWQGSVKAKLQARLG